MLGVEGLKHFPCLCYCNFACKSKRLRVFFRGPSFTLTRPKTAFRLLTSPGKRSQTNANHSKSLSKDSVFISDFKGSVLTTAERYKKRLKSERFQTKQIIRNERVLKCLFTNILSTKSGVSRWMRVDFHCRVNFTRIRLVRT